MHVQVVLDLLGHASGVCIGKEKGIHTEAQMYRADKNEFIRALHARIHACSFISALSQEDNKQSCSAKVHVVKPNSLDVDFVICAKAGEWELKCFVPSASRNCVLWLQTVLGYAP